jgi:hypothetical protein
MHEAGALFVPPVGPDEAAERLVGQGEVGVHDWGEAGVLHLV